MRSRISVGSESKWCAVELIGGGAVGAMVIIYSGLTAKIRGRNSLNRYSFYFSFMSDQDING